MRTHDTNGYFKYTTQIYAINSATSVPDKDGKQAKYSMESGNFATKPLSPF